MISITTLLSAILFRDSTKVRCFPVFILSCVTAGLMSSQIDLTNAMLLPGIPLPIWLHEQILLAQKDKHLVQSPIHPQLNFLDKPVDSGHLKYKLTEISCDRFD